MWGVNVTFQFPREMSHWLFLTHEKNSSSCLHVTFFKRAKIRTFLREWPSSASQSIQPYMKCDGWEEEMSIRTHSYVSNDLNQTSQRHPWAKCSCIRSKYRPCEFYYAHSRVSLGQFCPAQETGHGPMRCSHRQQAVEAPGTRITLLIVWGLLCEKRCDRSCSPQRSRPSPAWPLAASSPNHIPVAWGTTHLP